MDWLRIPPGDMAKNTEVHLSVFNARPSKADLTNAESECVFFFLFLFHLPKHNIFFLASTRMCSREVTAARHGSSKVHVNI